jgi:hypothetical protein
LDIGFSDDGFLDIGFSDNGFSEYQNIRISELQIIKIH